MQLHESIDLLLQSGVELQNKHKKTPAQVRVLPVNYSLYLAPTNENDRLLYHINHLQIGQHRISSISTHFKGFSDISLDTGKTFRIYPYFEPNLHAQYRIVDLHSKTQHI